MSWGRRLALAAKVSAGNIVCSLVVFVPQISYVAPSQAAWFYLLSTAFVADSQNIGSNIQSAAVIFICPVMGALFSALVNLVVDDAAASCVLIFVALPLCYILRFGSHPKLVSCTTQTYNIECP